MISTYSKLGLHKESLETFFLMHWRGTQIDCFTFSPVLKSCTLGFMVNEGKQVHCVVMSNGYDSNAHVQTGLMNFYAKMGDLDSAKRVFNGIEVKNVVSYNCLISAYSKSAEVLLARELFDEMEERNVVSWNSMITCYSHNDNSREGLRVFERMMTEKCPPNEMTLVTVLSICAKLGDLEMGLKVKRLIDDDGLCKNMIVSTAILEMYVKCGAVDDARLEFDQMARRDVVAWSAMIAGYAQNGRTNDALELFERMKNEGFKPNDITLVSVLSACAQLGSIEAGERIGKYVESRGLSPTVHVGSALLNMYAKCGNVGKARQLFDYMNYTDIVVWNTMIGGLAYSGFANDAINLFMKMKDASVKPNDVTFVGVLTACTHAGLVELGYSLFDSMKMDHGIIPKAEHCACIVDLLCKRGRLEEAYKFICKMEMEPNAVIWGTLLSACRIRLNVELAEQAVEKLLVLEPENSGNYVLLCNIYASTGKWNEASKMRSLMKDNRVKKTAGYSWIEMNDVVHKFLVGDTSHPRFDEICNIVDELGQQSQLAGYDQDPHLEFA
ncbi:hypothetical protein GIB67_042213 [Kingdonia uniflora]|uniref:Pentatricopeptide repeat-containing protein n=1 Tax=Kingdonia uniflora TaxID=39325 RepID=A0A7J7LE32_9MAGN|nr:hypothetical protein GIB67_042213 [Kingdonia uniflora]